MENFVDILQSAGAVPCNSCTKYPSIGATFSLNDQFIDGLYWYYETDSFIIDIHDFFAKRELIRNNHPDLSSHISIISTYVVTGNGETLNPYRNMTSNTVFVASAYRSNLRFLLHGNCPFLSVGMNFKDKMLEQYVINNIGVAPGRVFDIFFETQDLITKPLGILAKEILNCNMEPASAKLFMDAKAKEWLSIILNAYAKRGSIKPLSKSDEGSIQDVIEYINDHYASDMSQDLLEKIAMMSGTKLKSTFRQKTDMSITEYVQRKRINMAENLLLTTQLDIKDISKSVGYTSHSRFASLFKRYKGVSPKEIKKLQGRMNNCPCQCSPSKGQKP